MPPTATNYSLKIGYVPLIDSAPLLVADEEGLFEEEGVHVSLSEEVGWATVRDKLIHGELDMASTLIGLPYAMHNGVGCFQTSMSIPLIMNANGNTICLTNDVSALILKDSEALSETLNLRAAPHNRKWTFATVNPYSSHIILLFRWLSLHLNDFISEIEIVFMPPQLMPEMLEKGMIDGFCAGEPWGYLAESNESGWVVSSSIELSQNHPEKVLAVPKMAMDYKADGVKAVGRALQKALNLCHDPNYAHIMAKTLANLAALEMTEKMALKCLTRTIKNNTGDEVHLHTFAGNGINKPSPEKEGWVLKGLKEAGLFRKKVIATGKLMNPNILF